MTDFTPVQQLVAFAPCVQVLDDCVQHPRDAVASVVQEAWVGYANVEERVSGAKITPRLQVQLLDMVSRQSAVCVLSKEDLPALMEEVEWNGHVDISKRKRVCSTLAFDPTLHVCVCTDVTPAFWLEASHFGAGARLLTPARRAALLWWTAGVGE